MTCYFHEEKERPNVQGKITSVYVSQFATTTPIDTLVAFRKFGDVLKNIHTAIVNLPKPVRRVCYVQLFAFMGWCVSQRTIPNLVFTLLLQVSVPLLFVNIHFFVHQPFSPMIP